MEEIAHPQLAAYYPAAYRRLVGTLRLMGVPDADSHEVAQEAFVRLIPRWDQVVSGGSPDGWLRTVAWRIHLNRRRAWSRVRLRREIPDHVDGADFPVEDQIDLRAALSDLPIGFREVVVLHYLFDAPIAAIAADLGIASGTVKSRLARARAALAAALDEQEDRHAHRQP